MSSRRQGKHAEHGGKTWGNIIRELEVTMHDVMEQLTKLKIDKSPGSDRMHPHVLHRLRRELVTPLTKVVQHSAASRTLPEQCKTAHVFALHKKPSRKKSFELYACVVDMCGVQNHGEHK